MRRPKRHQLHINAPDAPDALNADSARLVLDFANALAAKLARARARKKGMSTQTVG